MLRLSSRLYRQFDGDPASDTPAASYGGWFEQPVEFPFARTALVSMHAWGGRMGEYPGWDRVVDYRPRSFRIVQEVFVPLLAAAREAGMPVFHVVGGGDYYKHFPGHRLAREAADRDEPAQPPLRAPDDPALAAFRTMKDRLSFPGEHNLADVKRGFTKLDFADGARPVGEEWIAEDGRQLHAACRHFGITHLVYIGFAINWCLVMSPGSMPEMTARGYFCSTIRDATSAVECRESARGEGHKEEGLWRVAVGMGFIFDSAPFIAALEERRRAKFE